MNDLEVPAVELTGLTKDYAIGLRGIRLRAIDNVSLRVPAGQIFGLLGANGSGKSTTIKIMLGLVQPTRGASSIFGVPSQHVEARLGVGYLPESPQFPRYLTGRELVNFYARICGVSGALLKARVEYVFESVGLAGAVDRRIETYSKGMLQRIGLAQALVHDPNLVILDEPTAGVDPAGAEAMLALILKLKAEQKTVIITTHLITQIDTICDRIAILDRGRVLAEETVGQRLHSDQHEIVNFSSLDSADREELRAWLLARGKVPEIVGASPRRIEHVVLEHVGGKTSRRENK